MAIYARGQPSTGGGYPAQNTAEEDNGLFSLTIDGARTTAVGFNALFSKTGGRVNRAVGASTLASNNVIDNSACGSYALANNDAKG